MNEKIYSKASIYCIMADDFKLNLDDVKFIAVNVGLPMDSLEFKLKKLDKNDLEFLEQETGGFPTKNIYCLELKDKLVYDKKDSLFFGQIARRLSDAIDEYEVKVNDVFSVPETLKKFSKNKDIYNQIY